MAHTAILPGVRGKSGFRLRDVAKRVIDRISVPASVRKLAEIPLTTMGLGSIIAGISLVCLPAALIVGGFALIGLEYLIADGV